MLVQVWRNGSEQANLSRLLTGAEILPLDAPTARAADQLCGVAARSDDTDAVVAVIVAARGAVLVTSDPDDLAHLLARLDGGDRVGLVVV